MQLRLKEDPKEWRKSVLLTVPAVALISFVLHWRRVLSAAGWIAVMVLLALIIAAAFLSPQWFRGYYRVSMRLGFALSQLVARLLLVLVFIFLITPLALVFRLLGKDALRLKRQPGVASYWVSAKESSPLDRMF